MTPLRGDIWKLRRERDVLVVPVAVGWKTETGEGILGGPVGREAVKRFPRLPSKWGAWCRKYRGETGLCYMPDQRWILLPVQPLQGHPAQTWKAPTNLTLLSQGLDRFPSLLGRMPIAGRILLPDPALFPVGNPANPQLLTQIEQILLSCVEDHAPRVQIVYNARMSKAESALAHLPVTFISDGPSEDRQVDEGEVEEGVLGELGPDDGVVDEGERDGDGEDEDDGDDDGDDELDFLGGLSSAPPPVRHHCHAEGCQVDVPPRMFACRKHWGMVTPKWQRMLWKVYSPGQEVRKDPTILYLLVQTCCRLCIVLVERGHTPETYGLVTKLGGQIGQCLNKLRQDLEGEGKTPPKGWIPAFDYAAGLQNWPNAQESLHLFQLLEQGLP